MQMNQINAFIAIAKSGSLARAAELVHATPAALSQRIKQFESRLGAQVFVRSNKGMELSPQGEVIYDHALNISEEVKNLLASVSKVSIENKRETLVVSNGFNPENICKLTLSSEIENYAINIRRMGDDSILMALKSGHVNMCIGFFSFDNENIKSIYLGTNTFVCVSFNKTKIGRGNLSIAGPNIPNLMNFFSLGSADKVRYNDCYDNILRYAADKGYYAIMDKDFALECINKHKGLNIVGESVKIPFYLNFNELGVEKNILNPIKGVFSNYLKNEK
ncbi:LysR family transcriptional regulator [Photobacterium angustum]|uniref:HTH lysR-type domain-containing protein n=1 Tax=Photobacterium angustum TaxID=661 RepID=A0A2S7VJF6_PHOAN|nr:LysR family transcriptional regulator [Photobacterium angustum]PQJ62287.1 hypothetical protein BTO08_18785 [Photobacterium angustum]